MEQVLQSFAVGLIVLSCAVFAAWRLTPASVKLRMLNALKPDTAYFWGRVIARLRRSVAEELAQGCGACSRSGTHVRKH
jgi:hypothetical protein